MSLFSHSSLLAIDIHATDVRIGLLSGNRMVHMQSFAVPAGAFQKDTLVKPEIVEQAIKDGINTIPGSSRDAIIIVPDIYCFMRTCEIADTVADDDIAFAVKAQAAEKIPFNQDHVYWDIYPDGIGNGTKTFVYICVPKEIIDQYISIAKNTGLNLVRVIPEVLILSKLFLGAVPENQTNQTTTMIVTSGDNAASLTTFGSNGKFLLTSIVPFVGGQFTRSITQSLAQGTLGQSQNLDPATAGTAKETVLQTALQTIVSEIDTSRNYIQELFHQPLGKVIIAGELGMLPNLSPYMSSLLGIPAVIGTIPTIATPSPGPQELFITILGITKMLDEKKPINLLPTTHKGEVKKEIVKDIPAVAPPTPKKTDSPLKKWLAYCFIILTFAILAFIVYKYIFVPLGQH